MIGISIREFARRDGCDKVVVSRALKRGRLVAFEDGTLDPALVGTGWRLRAGDTFAPAATAAARGEPKTLAEAEFRKAAALAVKAEIDLKLRIAQYVDLQQVRAIVADAVEQSRSLIESIPPRLARECERQPATIILDRTTRICHQTLEALADLRPGNDR